MGMPPVASGMTVADALARVRSAQARVSPRLVSRRRTPTTTWDLRRVGAMVLLAPVALSILLGLADAAGHRGHVEGSAGVPRRTVPPAVAAASSRAAGTRRKAAPASAVSAATRGAPAPGTTTTTAPVAPGRAGPGGAAATRPGGGPSVAASPGEPPTVTAGTAASGIAAAGPAAPPATTATPGGGGAALSAGLVLIWGVEHGAALDTLTADVTAVQGASPVAGDYSTVVPVWQRLAADVATAQGLPAVPDPTVEATFTAALGELAAATADWLASLSSTSPAGGTVALQATFDAGTAQFAQGVSALQSVAASVAAP